MKVDSSGFVPLWTLNATLKVSVMDGTTEFAAKTFTFAEAFPNNVEDTPFRISESWVVLDFGTKTSSAKAYTIKITPAANVSTDQQISVFVYGSETATGNVGSAAYSMSTQAFGTTPATATSVKDGSYKTGVRGRLYYSWFSSNDMPTTTDINGGRASFYWHEYTGIDRRIAWMVMSKAQANWSLNSVRFFAKLNAWDNEATLTIRVYSNSSGNPGTQLASGSVSKIAMEGVKDKAGWVTVPLSAPYPVASASTPLWISLEADTPDSNDKIDFDITCGKRSNYDTRLSSATDGLAFGSWSDVGLISATVSSWSQPIRTITTTADHSFKAGMRVRIGASLAVNTISKVASKSIELNAIPSTAPVANNAITEVVDYDPIWVLNEGSGSSGNVEIAPVLFGGRWYCAGGTQLYELNASSVNKASGVVASVSSTTITLQSTPAFQTGDYISVRNEVRLVTGVNTTNKTVTVSAAPPSATVAGDIVSGVAVWSPKYSFGNTVRCLSSLAEYMYVGFGESATCERGTRASNGTFTFSQISDSGVNVYGQYMRQHLGYLYIARATGGANCLRATNGDLTKWDKITVGTADIEVTALASLGANLIVLSKTRMYEISSIYASHMYNYEIEANTNNGKGAIQWVADGRLYVPIKNGLNAFDGVKMTPVGPEQDYGLPDGMQGYISSMAGTKDFLFASINAGSAGFSSVLAYNGRGWHTVYKASQRGQTIQAIGMEALTDARPRLWVFQGSQAFYITFPSLTDNPYQYVGAEYDDDDSLTSSWFGGELSAVLKDMQSVFVKADDCTQTSTIKVEIEADNSGVWYEVGAVDTSPFMEFSTEPPYMTVKTISSVDSTSDTKMYVRESVGDIRPGMFISVNNEVRQVKQAGRTPLPGNIPFVVISAPLSELPTAGDLVLPSRPVGKEFRYRATLSNGGDSSKSPKLVRVSFRMQEYTLSRFRFSLSAVIDDEVLLRTGAVDRDMEATQYRTEVYSWMKRTTPFVMVAPDGKNWRVKIMSGSESSWTRKEIGQSNQRFSSVIQLQLDEV
jgi:hypothetical protein